MKKNYLFTLAALLLGSTIANAQKPLDGYEAPSFTAPGNCGKVISLSTSGALENYTDLKDLTTGKIEQELFVAPGAKVEFSIKITTFWGFISKTKAFCLNTFSDEKHIHPACFVGIRYDTE